MKHNSDKDFFEYLVKNVLQYYNLIENDFQKSEEPDWISNKIGLEITRADQTLDFDGFIAKYPKEKITNIKKFNLKFQEVGGRIFKVTDPIVKILNLKDTFYYDENYIYIIPSYKDDFDYVNKKVMNKLEKLNKNYNSDINTYYLGIFTPVYATEEMIKNELIELCEIQKEYKRKYEKIIIVFIDKICEFNLSTMQCNIIDETNETLNKLSSDTSKELDLINNH